MKELLKEKLSLSQSYEEYRQLVETLVAEGKTSGPNQSESMVRYTKMNAQRMNRLDKKMELNPRVGELSKSLEKEYIWLVITEAWCGDAAQILPIFQKIVEKFDKITMRVVLRDEHLDLMDQFLTGGARAIPKLIILDKKTLEVVNSWGPRPAPAQEMLMEFKANPNLTYDEFSLNLQKWYNRDKGKTTQEELIHVLKSLNQLLI